MAVTVSRLQRTVHRLAATLFGPIVRLGKADFTNATIEVECGISSIYISCLPDNIYTSAISSCVLPTILHRLLAV